MDTTPKHILVVDDESSILEVFQALLRDEPYRMSYAMTGREAVDILQTGTVDLAFVDKNLPDMSGMDVVKIAKQIRPLTEVIIISGYASLETVLSAISLDVFDYLVKPLANIFDIQTRIRLAFEKQDMVLENQRLVAHLKEHAQALEKALEERKRAEAELIQSEKLAGIGTLASGVAHEVSSPLFGILGLAEAIEDEDDLETVRSYAREIVEYSHQIRDIVQGLSAYSREARNDGLERVEVKRAVDDAIRLVSRSRRLDNVKVVVQVDEGVVLVARPNELQQVIVNLVKNAVDALAEVKDGRKPVITIRGFLSGDQIFLTVADNGTGIPAGLIEKVFDPFFTTKEVGKGTGLGLNIVFRIVDKYHGTASVESVEGQSTTFTLRFPTQVA